MCVCLQEAPGGSARRLHALSSRQTDDLQKKLGLVIYATCDVEHTSFHFSMCGRKFVLCLFDECPGFCIICHSWQHAGVVHLSLKADGKVAFVKFEEIPVFGVFRPAYHDSSLNLFVLVLLLEAVFLSQVYVAFKICYQHIVNVYWGVVYNHHLCRCPHSISICANATLFISLLPPDVFDLHL